MKMNQVKSSNIKSIGYDEIKQQMRVEFYSGGLYEYDKVPRNIFLAFMKTKSLGKYFFRKIKNKYTYEKISK